MSQAFQSALAAVSAMQNLRMGTLVTHRDAPGEHFFVEKFDGVRVDGGFDWKVWVRPVEKHTHLLFPANANELVPVQVN